MTIGGAIENFNNWTVSCKIRIVLGKMSKTHGLPRVRDPSKVEKVTARI